MSTPITVLERKPVETELVEREYTYEELLELFPCRLKEVAGFKYVPEPLAMKNRTGAVVYYLFFASHNPTGDKIARAVFTKYKNGAVGNGN